MTISLNLPDGVTCRGPLEPGFEEILSHDALAFVAELARTHRPAVTQLLAARKERQKRIDSGEKLDFLPETAELRAGDWKVGPLPADILDRRVEITGPIDRKMIINALNAGTNVFMADCEDSNAPTWHNTVQGQVNLRDAVDRSITFTNPKNGKFYSLVDNPAVLFVRPRGWHLQEQHLLVDGEPVPAGIFDFGLFFFHNVREQLARGTGPYFYLPKLEHHLEARLWNNVFVQAQGKHGVPVGTIKATVLIETLPAAFQMDEILYELRQHSAGLNCGRWDYIFSFIKVHGQDGAAIIPDRGQVGMAQHFMESYSKLVIKTCHKRGAHAMGGMAAQIPIKNDAAANEAALDKVRADKLREVQNGHDGTWVAHPGLVGIAKGIFDEHMPGKNQIDRQLDVEITADDLLKIPTGTRSVEALRHNIRVGIQYIEAWLRGTGCVPIYNLMEDAATAEISRTQVWQWLKYGVTLTDEDGSAVQVDRALVDKVTDEEMARIETEVGAETFAAGRFADAQALFLEVATAEPFVDFLTLPAYQQIRTFTA